MLHALATLSLAVNIHGKSRIAQLVGNQLCLLPLIVSKPAPGMGDNDQRNLGLAGRPYEKTLIRLAVHFIINCTHCDLPLLVSTARYTTYAALFQPRQRLVCAF